MKSLSFKILAGLLLVVFLLIMALGIFLSLGKDFSDRHQAYDYPDNFDFEAGSFEEYLSYSQNHLRVGRVENPSEELIQNASPFMLEPGPECFQLENGKYLNGIVLSHGLIASPYSMSSIADYFQSRCFYVLVPLLPDHVTRPGDFLATHWESWALTQSFALQELEKKVENTFLSGHSAGATLAVYEAAINSSVDGLILFTPAMQITAAAKYAKYIASLAWIFPKATWFEVREDESDYRYESITMSAAAQTYALIQATNQVLSKAPLSIPVFTVASIQDNTVDTESTLTFMAQQPHSQSHTLLYSQHPVAPTSDQMTIYESYGPEQRVLSISHLGIMTAPTHPEYGIDGAYRNCGHYYGQETDNHQRCQSGERDFYGEVTAENLEQGLIERIAFNPFYEDLLVEIDQFLININAISPELIPSP